MEIQVVENIGETPRKFRIALELDAEHHGILSHSTSELVAKASHGGHEWCLCQTRPLWKCMIAMAAVVGSRLKKDGALFDLAVVAKRIGKSRPQNMLALRG